MRTGNGRITEGADLRQGSLALVLSAVAAFGILKMGGIYGFLLFPDEFAYWSYGAWVSGYDWSDITSLGPYFSYGYGLVLLPVFQLCRDAVSAYRIAVGLNFVFLAAAYLLLARAVRRMFPEADMPGPLFAALTVLVPWNLFYAQVTMTETLLVFLYTASGYLLYRYLEEDRLQALLLLMLALAYAYTVHMRTVGILLSALTVLTVHILRGEKKRHLLVILGTAALLFPAAAYMKDYAFAHVFGGMDPVLAADNDYGGQLAKIGYICTREGFYDLIVTVLGGILYLGLATFGLFYWGIFALARFALQTFRIRGGRRADLEDASGGRRRGTADAGETARAEMAFYVLLTVAAQILIASVYLLGRGEVDDYTYGRYSELIVPFVTTAGFAALWKVRRRTAFLVTGIFAAAHAAVLFMVTRQIARTGSEQYLGYFMVGISYLYGPEGYTPERFYLTAWLFGEFLTLAVAALVFFCRSRRGKVYLLALLAVLELALAVRADNLYLLPFKNAAFRDTRVADRIVSLAGGGGRDVIYMDDGRRAYIGILQFMDRDVDIRVMKRKEEPEDYGEEITAEDVLVFAFDDPHAGAWAEKYTHEDTYGHFTILYND